MANIQRLTKRVNDLEKWIKENETTGGPQGTLDTFVFLLNGMKNAQAQSKEINRQLQQLRAYAFEFIEVNKLGDEWNEFLKEKDNAVQEQQTEEDAVQEEAESSEEASEAPVEETKD